MFAASKFRTSQLFVKVLPYSEVPCVYCEVFNLLAQIGHMLLGECPICEEMKYFGVTQGTRANATHELGLFVDSLESRGAQMQVELITSGLQHHAVKGCEPCDSHIHSTRCPRAPELAQQRLNSAFSIISHSMRCAVNNPTIRDYTRIWICEMFKVMLDPYGG
jgi:hypothetical protein